jgi:4-amino-4-deoxy-L-arabinose transferase-like glycosyltransferase
MMKGRCCVRIRHLHIPVPSGNHPVACPSYILRGVNNATTETTASAGVLARLGTVPLARQRWWLLAGCLVLCWLWPLSMPLTEVDEARFCGAVQEMVTSGHYLLPTFNGAPRYQKPILYYWVQAGAVRLFGASETAARLPSALAMTLLVLLVHAGLWRRLPADPRGRGAAFVGAAVLLAMPLTVAWGRAAVTDALLTLGIAGACLALLEAEFAEHPRRWYVAAAAAAGLAVLTKGPIGVVIPALAWVGFHLSQRRLGAAAARVPWPAALAVFLLVAVPWYAATYVAVGPAFLRHFFLTENLTRFAAASMEGHGWSNRLLGLLTYLPVTLLLAFPGSAWALRDLVLPGGRRAALPEPLARLRRFAWAWLLAVIGLFSLSKTQLPSYMISAGGAVALLTAVHLYGGESTAWARRAQLAVLALVATLLLGGATWALWQPGIPGPLGTLALPPAARVIGSLLGAFGVAYLVGLARLARRPDALAGWAVGAWMAGFAVIALVGAPLAVRSAYGTSAAVGRALRDVPAGEPVIALTESSSESLVYYARRPILLATQLDDDVLVALRAGRVTVATEAARVPALQAFGRVEVRATINGIAVVRVNTPAAGSP